ICGGAFDGLEEIIEERQGKRQIGFKPIEERAAGMSDEENILVHVEPEDLLRYGLIPELVGRLPVLVALHDLDEDALVEILEKPKNALLKQYAKMFELEGVGLTFDPEALRSIAKRTIERGTGARGLRAVLESIMLDVMFDLPSRMDVREVVVTKETVDERTQPLLILEPEPERKEA
ncbi:MAG: ATP-dependent Clp protease ATP-binding subunit ClpX, partial [Gemmatimonadota bacterium]